MFSKAVKLIFSFFFFSVKHLDGDLQEILVQIGRNIFMINTSKSTLKRLEKHNKKDATIENSKTLIILEKSFNKIAILQENMFHSILKIKNKLK